MRSSWSGVLNLFLCWLGFTECALLSMMGDSLLSHRESNRVDGDLKLSEYLVDRGAEPVKTRINVAGRRLLQTTPYPMTCPSGTSKSAFTSFSGLKAVTFNSRTLPVPLLTSNFQVTFNMILTKSNGPGINGEVIRLSTVGGDCCHYTQKIMALNIINAQTPFFSTGKGSVIGGGSDSGAMMDPIVFGQNYSFAFVFDEDAVNIYIDGALSRTVIHSKSVRPSLSNVDVWSQSDIIGYASQGDPTVENILVYTCKFDVSTCSLGSYCPEGATQSTPCQAGYYCTTPSTQVKCPVNQISPAGSTSVGQCYLHCDADTYKFNSQCYPCPGESTSNLGSTGYTSCLCNVPKYRIAYDVIYGRTNIFATDNRNFATNRIFIIRNFILPKYSPKVGTVISSWTVTTVKACTIQPFITSAGNDQFFTNPPSGQQNNYIVFLSAPVAVPGAGTFTFPWTVETTRGGNVLSSSNSMSLGWYDFSYSGNCISTNVTLTGSQQLGSWVPLNPLWQDAYYGNFQSPSVAAEVALQINSDPVGVPAVMSCNNCSANFYYVSNTQCNACPVNSVSPEGSANIDSCMCNKANMFMNEPKACACNANFYMSGGTTCLSCPGNLVSPIASTLLSSCTCIAPALRFNSTLCVCSAGTFGDGRVCTECTLGNFCPQGSTASSMCPAGRFCSNTSTSMVCSSGMLCLAGSTSQQACPAGSVCATPSIQLTCPANSYCPVSSTVAVACPDYFTSPSGSSAFNQCVMPAVCPANKYCTQDTIYSCPVNSVSEPGAALISQCTCTNTQLTVINSKCSCPSGKFLSGGNCVTCPPGMVCAVSLDISATCSQGSYCPSGSATEIPCQAGSYCATPSTQVQCPTNTYCPASATVPINCPLDFISPAGSSLLAHCEAQQIEVDFGVDGASVNMNETEFKRALPSNVALNSFEDIVVLSIGSCPRGYYCPVDTTVAVPCPASTYNNDTHADTIEDCLTCPVGQYCPIASLLPTACPAGTYRIMEGAAHTSDCTVCPTGNYCPIQSVTPANCSAGTYGPNSAATSSAACEACPSGEYCPIATTTPVACASGSYRGIAGGAQQSDCDVCPVGQFCPLRTTTPTDCAAGSYRGSTGAAQQGDCAICITGNYCPIKSVDPTNCSISTYGPVTGGTSQDSCPVCPTGQYCPIATTTPISCAAGSYRGSTGAGAQVDCTVCPSGNYCPVKSVDPVNCSAGTYNPVTAQTSAAACLACTPGDYCPVATTTPSECAADTFTAGTGAAVCEQCPTFSTSPIASTNCTCNAGHFHVVISGSAGSNAISVTGADTYLASTYPNNAVFTSLGDGMLSYPQIDSSMHVMLVQGGVYTLNAVSSFKLKLFSKLAGIDTLVLFKKSMQSIPVDDTYFIDFATFTTSVSDSGTFSYTQGVSGQDSASLAWDTSTVPSGLYYAMTDVGVQAKRYAIDVFVASLTPVTLNYQVSGGGAIAIFACIGDTIVISRGAGMTTAMYWIVCDDANGGESEQLIGNTNGGVLTWTVTRGSGDERCVLTGYNPSTGGPTLPAIFKIYPRPTEVPSATAIAAATSSLTCANCTSGYRSDPGAPACTECGLGFYSNPVSQTCTACPAGTKCPTTTSPAPVSCGAGNYQSQPTQSTCLPCPVGQYCDLAKTVTPIDCPAGTFRSTEGAASLADCQTCTLGNYCPIKSVDPTHCAAGSYRSTTGAQSQAQCDVCTVGNYCPIQSVNPTNCAAGSYRNTVGAESQAQCDVCTTGNYCPIQSINPTNCLAGTYNPTTGGTQPVDCLACPAGEFCPTETTTPTSCSAGSYRGEPGGTSQSECTSCPSGNFCPIKSINPTNCSAGTYNPAAGSVHIDACLSCPLGEYCHIATTDPSSCAAGSYRGSVGAVDQAECTVCPSGNFCPIQSINPVNCSSGTFRPTSAGAAVSDCTVCATGKYSLNIASSTDCPLCPANYYCSNSITVKTCPTHTSSNLGSSSLLHCRCDQGYKCAYSKRITAVVTLNATTSSFNSDRGGIRTAFINAVADAAGVSSNQVTINSVIAKGSGGRRLLSLEGGFIDVFASVDGAERLHKLDLHLSKHSLTLHQGHSWQEAHSVVSTSVRRGATLSTR